MAERTCLIVDDSKIVRKVMRKIIEPLGFAILIFPPLKTSAHARCRL